MTKKLRIFRRKNTKVYTSPPTEKIRAELELTLQAISDENSHIALSTTGDTSSGSTENNTLALDISRKSSDACEADMEKLLDRYSEKLVGIIDMRIAAGVATNGVVGRTLKGRESQTPETTVFNDSSNSRVSGNNQSVMNHDMKSSD